MTNLTHFDKADLLLLRAIQENANQTIESLAEQAGLSRSVAQRRLQKLRAEKVIVTETAVLDPRKLGLGMTFVVELELRDDRPDHLPPLFRWISTQEAIQQAWHLTGRGDLMLIILSPSVEAFDALMEKLMDQNRNVLKFTTSLALRTLKQSQHVPICMPA